VVKQVAIDVASIAVDYVTIPFDIYYLAELRFGLRRVVASIFIRRKSLKGYAECRNAMFTSFFIRCRPRYCCVGTKI